MNIFILFNTIVPCERAKLLHSTIFRVVLIYIHKTTGLNNTILEGYLVVYRLPSQQAVGVIGPWNCKRGSCLELLLKIFCCNSYYNFWENMDPEKLNFDAVVRFVQLCSQIYLHRARTKPCMSQKGIENMKTCEFHFPFRISIPKTV